MQVAAPNTTALVEAAETSRCTHGLSLPYLSGEPELLKQGAGDGGY